MLQCRGVGWRGKDRVGFLRRSLRLLLDVVRASDVEPGLHVCVEGRGVECGSWGDCGALGGRGGGGFVVGVHPGFGGGFGGGVGVCVHWGGVGAVVGCWKIAVVSGVEGSGGFVRGKVIF